jgi:serine/threonine-protein kinase RsbT
MPLAASCRVVPILGAEDLVEARRAVRETATILGFLGPDATRLVTAASELARNILEHAGRGTMCLRPLERGGRLGIELEFEDHGPGIPDLDRAMEEGFSTRGGTGMGLPGARHLMDEMSISSIVGVGTMIQSRKWR